MKEQLSIINYPLEKRSLYRVSGADAVVFLHGLLSADVKRLAAQSSNHSCEALLLSLKAKVVAWMQVIYKAEDSSLYLSLPLSVASQAIEELNKYVISEDVHFDKIKEQFVHLALINEPLANLAPKTELAKDVISQAAGQIGEEFVLKRHSLDDKLIEYHVDQGVENDEEIDFSVKYKKGFLTWDEDDIADCFSLEYPFAQAISFYKGCFRGQEIVARGTFRGKKVKSLYLVKWKDSIVKKSKIVNDEERTLGQIISFNDKYSYCLLRNESVDGLLALELNLESTKNSMENISLL